MSFPLDPVEPGFVRATLEFVALTPPVDSYIVHIFLDNAEATLDTPRQMDVGYAGQLALFGHGHCLGGPGHCDVPDRSDDPFDLRPSHHLEPYDTQVDISWPLATLLERQPEAGESGFTVTLVVADATGELADPSVVVFEALAVVTRV
jgi:tyrosinase